MDNVIKVSSKSNPNSVAGVISERGVTEIQVIGAGALNQAIKAIAIARGFVAPRGVNLVFVPAFIDILINKKKNSNQINCRS
jgi:stage V sporulation protein S